MLWKSSWNFTLQLLGPLGHQWGWFRRLECRLCVCREPLNLLNKISFDISFIVAKECLASITSEVRITTCLQKRVKDICEVYPEVSTALATLQDVNKTINAKHKTWHEAAVNLSQKVNASEPQLPRQCAVQQHRSNTPGDTPQEYYCRIISIPFLDMLFSHLES